MQTNEKIKALRKYRKWSSDKACSLYGMTRPTLQSRESGASDWDCEELIRIAEAYGCRPSSLIDGRDTIEINLNY